MKTTKQLSLLIFLAMLSFSCGEDEDKNGNGNGNGNKSSIDASKYLFQTNSKYYYDIEVIDSNGNKDFYKRDSEVYGFDTIFGKYALMYMENQEHSGLNKKNYLYAEGSKIYGINCGYNLSNHYDQLFSNSKRELFESILLIDFDKNEWESSFEFQYSPYDWIDIKITSKVNVFGRKLSEEKINFNGKNLNSFNIELIFDFKNYHFSEVAENYPKDEHRILTRNIILIESIGIIKDYIEIYTYDRFVNGEVFETTFNRNFTLEKIGEMK